MENEGKKTLTKVRQLDVVIVAVYLLGGDKRSIDTEDVAAKCHEIAPRTFSWRKYPKQINLELVRVVLSNAKKISGGELLSGSGREGWRLTRHGIDWLATKGKPLLRKTHFETDSARASAGSVDTVRKKREKNRVLSSLAWKAWSEGNLISVRDAQSLFRINEYTTEQLIEIKIVRLRSLFEDDKQLARFISQAADLVLGGRTQ